MCGMVAILAGHRTCDSLVAGSSPGCMPLCSGLRQATYTCVPSLPSSITWCTSRRVVTLCGWKGIHRSGVALAMCSGISTYRLMVKERETVTLYFYLLRVTYGFIVTAFRHGSCCALVGDGASHASSSG